MTADIMDRKRSVDVEALDKEQLDIIVEEISRQINVMVDDTVSKANKLLNIYGMETKMQIVIGQKGTLDKQ